MSNLNRKIENQLNPPSIFHNIGVGTFIAFIFMVVMFSGERLGTQPWLQLIYLEQHSDAKNMLFFIMSVIVAFSIAIFLLNLTLYNKRKMTMQNMNTAAGQKKPFTIFYNLGLATVISCLFLLIVFQNPELNLDLWLERINSTITTEAENVLNLIALTILVFFIVVSFFNLKMAQYNSEHHPKRGKR